jgi:hypothetical protein
MQAYCDYGLQRRNVLLQAFLVNSRVRVPNFIEGDDVALVESDARRVLVKIDSRQSGVP